MTTQTFEEAVAEFLSRSKEQIDQESDENLPPWMPAPYDQDGPPYEYSQRFTSDFITRYALSIGDNNPIFTDPEYGKTTRYGCQIAPGPAMALVRYPSVHGAVRPGGYPLANFISGAAWEFFDTIREGTKFRSSKVTKEIFEKPGSRGNLVFFISDNHYWDLHGDLLGKCYGTQIYVPMSSMGSSRSMPVERLGEQMLYERKTSQYSNEQIEEVLTEIKNEPRRGAETRYWEDVEEGDTVGPVTLSPWTLQDQVCYHSLSYATVSGPLPGVTSFLSSLCTSGRGSTRSATYIPLPAGAARATSTKTPSPPSTADSPARSISACSAPRCASSFSATGWATTASSVGWSLLCASRSTTET